MLFLFVFTAAAVRIFMSPYGFLWRRRQPRNLCPSPASQIWADGRCRIYIFFFLVEAQRAAVPLYPARFSDLGRLPSF